ncbi:MAG: hypothetical protein ACYDCL_12895 [Myxococcales bacterium]
MRGPLLAACSLVLAACTGDVCSQTQSLFEESAQVEERCIDAVYLDAGLTPPAGVVTPCAIDLGACEQRIKSCTTADLAVIQAQIDCENQQLAQVSESCSDAALTASCPDAGSLSATCSLEIGQVAVACDGGVP